ncbi:unnamed protein product, partial [Rotaria sp. Silwood2]
SSHLIQPMTTDTSTVMNELVADTEGNNNIRISSLIQPMTPKYNLKSQKMTDEHIDDLKEQLNYVKIDENTMINITGVAYLIVASNPCCSNPDVNNFILIVSNGFPPVNTSCEAFINFFKLLQSILSSRFVIELYRELINYEENVSQETIEQSLKDNISNLQKHMYLANLPDNYYALTLYDGKLLLNSSARGSDDDSIILSWAALLIVILDEIAHSLQRTIIPKARNLILAQTSPKNVLDGQREAGFCFETLVFGHKVESIGLLDGKYLLNSTNWNVGNAESFQNKLKEATTKDEEKTRKISAQVTMSMCSRTFHWCSYSNWWLCNITIYRSSR